MFLPKFWLFLPSIYAFLVNCSFSTVSLSKLQTLTSLLAVIQGREFLILSQWNKTKSFTFSMKYITTHFLRESSSAWRDAEKTLLSKNSHWYKTKFDCHVEERWHKASFHSGLCPEYEEVWRSAVYHSGGAEMLRKIYPWGSDAQGLPKPLTRKKNEETPPYVQHREYRHYFITLYGL